MITILRLAIILIVPTLLWVCWSVSPEIISPGNMRFLGALFLFVWTYIFHFFRKIGDISSLPGLTWREQERVVYRLARIRKRIWWIGAVVLFSGILVWFIGSTPIFAESVFAPLSIGLLLGIGASYLAIIPGWFNELHDFIDTVRLREDKKRRAEATLKQIADNKKNSSSSSKPTN